MIERPNAPTTTFTLFALLAIAMTIGCSSSPGGGAGGAGGGAGSGGVGSGGSGGGGNQGTGGSGGAAGSGGNQGSGGAGGAAGSGGGAGGSGGATGGSGGGTDAGADLAVDRAGDGSGTGMSVDSCFTGLRTPMRSFQDATHASADGAYRMRLVLEREDRIGTSGTIPWAAFAFALTTPTASVCITEPTTLAGAYTGSRHNCMDVLTVSAGGRRYVIRNPDSAVDYVNMTTYRRTATLTVFEGNTMVAGPITLPTIACNRGDQDGKCRSGGPCD